MQKSKFYYTQNLVLLSKPSLSKDCRKQSYSKIKINVYKLDGGEGRKKQVTHYVIQYAGLVMRTLRILYY